MTPWTPEDELDELERDLARERFALRMSERAASDGRVVNEAGWLEAQRRRRERIAELEAELAERSAA